MPDNLLCISCTAKEGGWDTLVVDVHHTNASQEHIEILGQVQCIFEFVDGTPQCKILLPFAAQDGSE